MANIAPHTPPASFSKPHIRTPDAPHHGARYEEGIGPMSPRRSRRSTRNPFSSSRDHKTPPPQASPPSPPASPLTGKGSAIAQRKERTTRAGALQPPNWDPQGLLLTPVKTPKTRTPPSTGSRRLNFQLAHPSDAMPTPRKFKKHGRTAEVEVFTDWNARIPTVDESDDNPFNGLPTPSTQRKTRVQKSVVRPLTRDMTKEEMHKRVGNDEGLIFTFRGKQVFRPYNDIHSAEAAEAAGLEPIQRSSNKPRRLLFDGKASDVDEEAITDIDEIGPSGQRQADESSSPFNEWPRTKSGARKREAGEGISTAVTKKARSDL